MDDHANGLVDHNQIVIFVPNIEGDVLGSGLKVLGDFDRDCDLIALSQPCPWIGHDRAIDLYGCVRHQTRKTRPAEVGLLWHIARDRLIKTGRGIFPDNKGDACVCQRRFPRIAAPPSPA